MSSDPTLWSPLEIAASVRAGSLSPVDLAQRFLERIEKLDPGINAFLTVDREGALRTARALEARRDAGERLGPLAGVPIAVKDNLCTAGLRTTCASRFLEHFVPPYDATVVRRLRQA